MDAFSEESDAFARRIGQGRIKETYGCMHAVVIKSGKICAADTFNNCLAAVFAQSGEIQLTGMLGS